jgi:hypothetical protein
MFKTDHNHCRERDQLFAVGVIQPAKLAQNAFLRREVQDSDALAVCGGLLGLGALAMARKRTGRLWRR